MNRPLKVPALLWLLLILAVTFVVFLPTFQYGFTNWDDYIHVTNNASIQHLDAGSVGELFRPTGNYMYHPLTMLSFAVDWWTGGGSARSFHVTSVVLHLLNVLVLFVLLRRYISSDSVVLFCTAVFALHPLQVESVAWISGRKELLYSFFYLLSLLFYAHWDNKKKWFFYVISCLFFACSLFSKPTAVTLPLVLLAAEWIRERKFTLRTAAKTAPYFTGALAFACFSVATQIRHTVTPVSFYSLPQRALFVAYEVGFYIWKAALPRMLSACYAYPQLLDGALPLAYYLAPVLLAVLMSAIWLLRRTSETILLGPLIYLITLSPVLQLIPFNNASLVADRYAYLPIVGLAYFFSQLVTLAASRSTSRSPDSAGATSVVFALIILLMLIPSLGRVQVWRNSITLFDDVIEKNDHIGIAYGNRADAKLREGNFSGALSDCEYLVALKPEDGKAYYDRGNALLGLRMYRAGLSDLTRSIQLGYRKSSVYYNRGTACYNLGQVDSAIADFLSSRSLDPAFADAPYSLGYVMLHSRGDPQAAIAYFDSAIAINRRYTEALYQKATAEYRQRAYGNAMRELSEAISYSGSLRSDPLVGEINRAVDSVNAKVAALRSLPGNASHTIETRRRLEEMYKILGDSLRGNADNTLAPSRAKGGESGE